MPRIVVGYRDRENFKRSSAFSIPRGHQSILTSNLDENPAHACCVISPRHPIGTGGGASRWIDRRPVEPRGRKRRCASGRGERALQSCTGAHQGRVQHLERFGVARSLGSLSFLSINLSKKKKDTPRVFRGCVLN